MADITARMRSEISAAGADLALRLPADIAGIDADKIAQHVAVLAGEAGVLPAGSTAAHATLHRRIIELVRAELVRRWSTGTPPDRDVMLATLQRLQQADDAATPVREQALAAELTDRSGLDLVVEVAHDMRSPLTSILFLADILHQGQSGPTNDVQRRQIGIIYSAALGLVGLASDLVEMARDDDRTTSGHDSPFSIDDMLDGVADIVRPMAEEKNLRLEVRHLASRTRLGSAGRLGRVLLNLTTNALKFTQDGGVELAARAIDERRVVFSVADTGPGVSDAGLETLYQPFRRMTQRDTGYSFSGTGLGLAICRRVVCAMGSELHVDTVQGKGTCFFFELELPVVAAD